MKSHKLMKTKALKKYPFQIILMTITFFFNMLVPLLFQYLIDEIVGNGNYDSLPQWFVAAFLICVVSVATGFYITQYNPVKIGIHNSFLLEKITLKNILKMNQTIFSQKDKGYYYNICNNSTSAYGDLHEEINLNMVSNIIYAIGILVFVTYVNAAFGIFFAIYGVILVIISLNSSKPLFHMQKDVVEKQDVYFGNARNIIENKMNINMLHVEDFFNKSFEKSVAEYEKHILKYQFFNYLCNNLPNMANQICNIFFLLVAAILVGNGEITAGVLIMGYQYMGYFAIPITIVCSILMRCRSNKIHIERVDELSEDANIEKENNAYKKEQTLMLRAGDFDFYKGEEEQDFLYHIDKIELSKNGLYIIKGENGSGKSMLMNLMLGNVSAKNSKGTFSIADNMDETAMLTYPFFAVNGSFTENLYGIPENKELKERLRIDFDDKELTANPINLSYGQQQKLALMRVFGTDAPILFLDEPLSNLDVETQEQVIAYITELKGRKSMLVIMHSNELDSVADGILTIQGNKMVFTEK